MFARSVYNVTKQLSPQPGNRKSQRKVVEKNIKAKYRNQNTSKLSLPVKRQRRNSGMQHIYYINAEMHIEHTFKDPVKSRRACHGNVLVEQLECQSRG